MKITSCKLVNRRPVPNIVVSRHPGAIAWVAKQLNGAVTKNGERIETPDGYIPVVAEVSEPEFLRHKTVIGNLPLHLAAVAYQVWAIEFNGPPPRGKELTLEDMEAAGARLSLYRVEAF